MFDTRLPWLTLYGGDVRELNDEESEKLTLWLDDVDLSSPNAKKNVTRSFSDGVYVAEVLKKKLKAPLDLRQCIPSKSRDDKIKNWNVLDSKVLSEMKVRLEGDLIKMLAACNSYAMEYFLWKLRERLEDFRVQRLINKQQLGVHAEDEKQPRGYIPSAEDQSPLARSSNKEQLESLRSPRDNLKVWTNDRDERRDNGQPATSIKQNPRGNRDLQQNRFQDDGEADSENGEPPMTMQQAKATIRQLEHLLALKDMRIDNLSIELEDLKKVAVSQQPRGGQQTVQGGRYY